MPSSTPVWLNTALYFPTDSNQQSYYIRRRWNYPFIMTTYFLKCVKRKRNGSLKHGIESSCCFLWFYCSYFVSQYKYFIFFCNSLYTMFNTLKRHQKKHGKTVRTVGIQEPMSVMKMLRRNTLTGYWSRSWPPYCMAAGCSPETRREHEYIAGFRCSDVCIAALCTVRIKIHREVRWYGNNLFWTSNSR